VGFGVGADVGETGWIRHARGLAGFGVGPALALLEFNGVIVEQLIRRAPMAAPMRFSARNRATSASSRPT
jgi:hypothetical protein